MVLQSQIPREGMGRRYVASHRKRRSRWPWLAVLAAVIVTLVIIMLPNGKGKTSAANAGASDGNPPVVGRQGDERPQVTKANGQEDQGPGDGSARGGGGSDRRGGSVTFNPNNFVQGGQGGTITPSRDTDLLRAEDNQDTGTQRPKPGTSEKTATNRDTAPPPVREVVQPTGPSVGRGSNEVQAQYDQAVSLRKLGRLLEARTQLNDLLLNRSRELTIADQQAVRDMIAELNDDLIFSTTPYSGDPLTEVYVVKSGDRLSKIAPKYKTTYQLIERINKINADRIRVGQRLKIIRGPIHARVSKSQFRIDLFAALADGRWIYMTSFPVGLGEDSSTPIGPFKVTDKVENPQWTNRRTNQAYGRDDPRNPIGEHWIRLKGTSEQTANLSGYGIHGTIEPQSVGQEASMGCVRMLADDVHMVYDMLIVGESTVEILP